MRSPSFLAFALPLLCLASCSPKLSPLQESNFAVTPSPLVVKGSKVETEVSVAIPAKWLKPGATVRFTPVMRYGSREAWGATSTIQGEKVRDNHPTLPYALGGKWSFTTQFDYEPNMIDGQLFMTFRADVDGKRIELPAVALTRGVVATATLASLSGDAPFFAGNRFSRIIEEKYDADIHFIIQQAQVRDSELAKTEVEEWKQRVESASRADNQRVAVEVQAYASPDGGVALNEKLSAAREHNTSARLKKELSPMAASQVPVTAHYTAQDWEGFRKYVEASEIPDKALILRVLSMYDDPEEREREIRNISVVFDQLASDILPRLRRSRLTATIETIGKSDDELTALLVSDPSQLSVEELLYAIELQPTASQITYLERARAIFPEEPRIYNNLAALQIRRGDTAAAEQLLEECRQRSRLPECDLNRALLAMGKGSLVEAETLIGNHLDTKGSETALALLYLKKGDFEQAARLYGSTASNNAAIAHIMIRDYAKAQAILEQIVLPNATTDYLRAVVAARQGDARAASNYLGEAFRRNPALRAYAEKDLEFATLRSHPDFTLLR